MVRQDDALQIEQLADDDLAAMDDASLRRVLRVVQLRLERVRPWSHEEQRLLLLSRRANLIAAGRRCGA